MLAARTTLALSVLGLIALAMLAGPTFAQTYTYAPLPDGISAADADGQVLRPNVKTTTTNPQPTVSGRVTTGASSVVVRVGSSTITATVGPNGQFTVTVAPPLTAGEYQVSFNGQVVGTIVISAPTPGAPRVGTGPTETGRGFDVPVLPVATGIAAAAVIGFYAVRHRRSLS